MKKTLKLVSMLLVVALSAPVLAVDINSLGISIPNIQDLTPSEQSGPKTSNDFAMEYPVNPNEYIVGPGDYLAIHIIIGDSELSVDHNLFVGADGNIFFPNIGSIYVSGMSLSKARDKINDKINRVYNEKYKLFVLLNQPKKVKIYLSGMVKTPGPIAVYDSSRISEVLSQAGGVASGASNRYVFVRRKQADGSENITKADLFEAYRSKDVSKDIRIQAGDIIEVPDSNGILISQISSSGNDQLLFEGKESFVYVYGEVSKSGRFEYIPGKKISDYISFAGGPNAKALLSWTTLTRQINGKPQKYTINVSDVIYNGNMKNDMDVMGGDVINVPGNFFYVSDFTSFVNTILLGLTLYNTVKIAR